jgi:protein-tyrosine phosphatase
MQKRISMKSLLFVCLGNICRSPIAEGIARKIVSERNLDIRVDSAGTGSWHVGEPPCPDAMKIAKIHDLDISDLRARQVTQNDIETFDVIVALDESNRNDLKSLGREDVEKLGCYGYNCADVPDPYFFDGFEGFEEVYKMIEICVNELFSVKLSKEEK